MDISKWKQSKERKEILLHKNRSNWNKPNIQLIVAFIATEYQCYCVPLWSNAYWVLCCWYITKSTSSNNHLDWWSKNSPKNTLSFQAQVATFCITVWYYIEYCCVVQHNKYYLFLLTSSPSHASLKWYWQCHEQCHHGHWPFAKKKIVFIIFILFIIVFILYWVYSLATTD